MFELNVIICILFYFIFCLCRSRKDFFYGKFFRDWKNIFDEVFKDNIWLLVFVILLMLGM